MQNYGYVGFRISIGRIALCAHLLHQKSATDNCGHTQVAAGIAQPRNHPPIRSLLKVSDQKVSNDKLRMVRE
jgi:hypothetical protein